jgi:hypothetical protein
LSRKIYNEIFGEISHEEIASVINKRNSIYPNQVIQFASPPTRPSKSQESAIAILIERSLIQYTGASIAPVGSEMFQGTTKKFFCNRATRNK